MDWTELLRADLRLALPEHHAEALTRAAARRFRDGAPADALALLRRRMRVGPPPTAAERALLGLVASAMGARAEADQALGEALLADPLDTAAGLIALRLAGGREARLLAARRILANPSAGDDALLQALSALFVAGEDAALRIDLADGRLTGWAIWRGDPAPVLTLQGPDGEERHALTPWPALAFVPPGASGARLDLCVAGPLAGWRLERGGRALAQGSLHARSRHRRRPEAALRSGPPDEIPQRRPIRVVMPVHGDPDATRDALRAAALEVGRHPGARLVAVDDCSPSPAITALLESFAARDLLELRRTPVNRGFPGAVALGLEGAEGADVVVLNADALLPAGALARLGDAAYAAPDIGTVTPFSNNGEWTSWPRLGHPAPLPSPPEAARLDAAARRLGIGPVALPNGIGFALFLRHDCLAAIGGPSEIYERGYFEDLDWTLEAGAAGFRNVAAPNLFVPHHGSRSFGADKALLVARNLRRLRRRYPGIRGTSAAFRSADPLCGARARLEEACPPAGRPLLLLGPAGSPTLAERIHRLGDMAAGAVVLRWRHAGSALRAELRGLGGSAPQSLGFDALQDADALAAWLAALAPVRIEASGPPPPAALLESLRRLDAPFTILGGDPAPAVRDALAAGLSAWQTCLGDRLTHVLALDRATLAALERHLASDPAAVRLEAALADPVPGPASPARTNRLALVMGVPSPASLAFAGTLHAALRAQGLPTGLAVLGASADDLALIGRGIGATGPLEAGEYAGAASGSAALVLPPADPSLALFERVLAETGLPGARVDWSDGVADSEQDILLLDRSHRERHTVQAIVDWFAGRIAA
ncbi:glycosyltransferase [Aureimonas sp. AU22]|uniref:glycosyltransferase n=1 Tax=Aureimonas sp. AU22 TaxID=1638162 RepID=UPI000781AEA8|nr:glycosyltransferase [Aureimonas sp. AU22]